MPGKWGWQKLSVGLWLTLALGRGRVRLELSALARPNQAEERQGKLPEGERTEVSQLGVLAQCKLRQGSPRASKVSREKTCKHSHVFIQQISIECLLDVLMLGKPW